MIVSEFRNSYPSFTNNDADITLYLDLFAALYGLSYGSISNHLQGLYVAHKLTIKEKIASNIGVVTGRTVGDISTDYNTEGNNNDINLTAFGREFASIIAAFAAAYV